MTQHPELSFHFSRPRAPAFRRFAGAALGLLRCEPEAVTRLRLGVDAGSGGLEHLELRSQDGRCMADLELDGAGGGDRHELVLGQWRADGAPFRATWPEGVYGVFGRQRDGTRLFAQARLSHQMTPPPQLLAPRPGQRVFARDWAALMWIAVPGAVRYEIELVDTLAGSRHRAERVPPDTAFRVPREWLETGRLYDVSLAADAGNGNVTRVADRFRVDDEPLARTGVAS